MTARHATPFRPSPAHLGLIAVTFLMWGGFFLIIPLVTVQFVGGLGWAAASVGLVLGVLFLGQYHDLAGNWLSLKVVGTAGLVFASGCALAVGLGVDQVEQPVERMHQRPYLGG